MAFAAGKCYCRAATVAAAADIIAFTDFASASLIAVWVLRPRHRHLPMAVRSCGRIIILAVGLLALIRVQGSFGCTL